MGGRNTGILVVGSGVGGLKASLELVERGVEVYLLESSPFIGGMMTYLDRQFPTDKCCFCQILPNFNRIEGNHCLKRDFYHPLINVYLCSEILEVSGERGDFYVRCLRRSRGIDEEKCIFCLKCMDACPEGAIYLKVPQPIPPKPAIDWERCTRCGVCEDTCPVGAINLEDKPSEFTLHVSSIILSSGFDNFDPSMLTQYGYKRFENVITSFDLERLLTPVSRFNPPRKIAFILCVGSRDIRWNYCSASCCMMAIKQANLLKEIREDAEITIFYMDIRDYGKDYHRYFIKARENGIGFKRWRVGRILENPEDKRLIVEYVGRDGRTIRELFDLVVLATSQRPSKGLKDLCSRLGIEVDEWGFVKTSGMAGIETSRPGIFACGSSSGPKDIHDTVLEATACALEALDEGVSSRRGEDRASEKVGVVICRCGGRINTEGLREGLRGIQVDGCWEVDYLCINPPDLGDVGRIVVCACSPHWFKWRLAEKLKIDPYFIEWLDIRNSSDPSRVVFSLKLLKKRKDPSFSGLPVKSSVLVIGGGISGLEAALSLSRFGIEVHIVEKSEKLGGALRRSSMSEIFKEYTRLIEERGSIYVHLNSKVVALDGYPGNFRVLIEGKDKFELNVGAIIVSIGSGSYKPKNFLYGDSRVLTQDELGDMIYSGKAFLEGVESVAMIQCVGSRDKEHPWCSRFCCIEAIENALKLKDMSKRLKIYVIFRDMMTYGLYERLYLEARKRGIVFIRWEDSLSLEGGDRIKIKVDGFDILCDLLVLSTGVFPSPDNPELSRILGIDIDENGFFKEADPKFRPVDSTKEGIFICGGCKAPGTWRDMILQGRAAAERALRIVGRRELIPSRDVSNVRESLCSGCGTCVDVCPYGARVIDEERGVARVLYPLCMGCGICVSSCPNGASEIGGIKNIDFINSMEELLWT